MANTLLKAAIIRRYGSNVAFSLALQVPETLVSRVIHGRQSLSPDEQRRWASALGCSPKIFDEQSINRWLGNTCTV